MVKYLRFSLITLLLFVYLFLAFMGGYLYHQNQAPEADFPLLGEANKLLLEHGLKEPPADPALEYGMIHGMLQAYGDPHTAFTEPPQNELQTQALEGKFGGIGAQLSQDTNGYWVLFPFPDGPASKGGIQDGDRLLAVDDLPILPETPADSVQSAIRGPVGEKVKLTVGRPPDYNPLDFTIKREEIPLPSVTWRLDLEQPSVGVIKVNLMAASTPDEIQRAVQDLRQRGASLFVLDLRDNPGGYLTAGVDIARLFLKEGVVMQQQYRGQEVDTYEVEKPGTLAEIPLVVLINQGSASAAEIAAGALQAQKRAPLIGVPSFGKDTIQLVFTLADQSSLRVTAARWWIPGLASPLEGVGLQPDILVDPAAQASSPDPILQAAIQRLLEGQ
ncbi:MAG: S41 family peptidase [Anaerolineales bacterium]|nr:S41 family peptidase [Anaerolineales bacterium]